MESKSFSPYSDLDTDYYKYTMYDFITEHYSTARTKFTLQVRQARLRFTEEELATLLFSLTTIQNSTIYPFPYPCRCHWRRPNIAVDHDRYGKLTVTSSGYWNSASMMETFIMSTINEIVSRRSNYEAKVKEAEKRLLQKVAVLKTAPHIKIADFGTRRRLSRDWHHKVVEILATECPENLVGTSNVLLAHAYNLKPVGTMAHEIFMGVAGLYPTTWGIRASQDIVLRQWRTMFPKELCVALTDTWGSDVFFRDVNIHEIQHWSGIRQDSGDPIAFAKKAIETYGKGITIVFSDGLTLPKILMLDHYFGKVANLIFGWGTNLTNDTGETPPNIVVKMTEINEQMVVKLSDEEGKESGPLPERRRYREIFSKL